MNSFDKNSLEITDIWTNRFSRADKEIQAFGIDWSANIGYGECTFRIERDNKDNVYLVADSEYMGRNFVNTLIDALKEKIIIID